jgi:hypothetical protein
LIVIRVEHHRIGLFVEDPDDLRRRALRDTQTESGDRGIGP